MVVSGDTTVLQILGKCVGNRHLHVGLEENFRKVYVHFIYTLSQKCTNFETVYSSKL